MSKTFEQGKDEIARLCKYFSANRDSFLAPGIKEAHVRLHLIDPFFECLGWDVRNTAMVAPQYREVVTEDSLEIEGARKAPDYSFRVGTLSKYYGEAKKCGININADPLPAYQLRRYGWSAKVPLSILTDFEEFGVYDCSSRPKPADKAGFGRLNYFHFEEYPDRWRELWDIFSRQAVWDGAFDQYAASRRKRGTTEVDGEFLKEIEGWRDALAHNIALRNRFLAPDDLNSTVQRTIDRLIFLRMAEDRGSESYGQLLKLCEQPGIYKRFIGKLCKSADEKYNSGLFHFQKEEGIAEAPDFISAKMQVDDKVFKPILQSLYFEHGSPYHFGVLPVELLGTVYERFLGKVIRLTADHRAKVEEKPEVRKAGGVYYTPAYIVDYIVKNTVGKMIEGKSPAQLAKFREGQPLRILDMACGSGSFLLGAFQSLLDHSLKWYTGNNPEKFKKEIYKTSKDEWRLTIAEKKRLLTTHIFGVDIDPQAVEVSKLSLLLKVMEGETDETVGQTRMLFHERALPNLSFNIKCGNSLIGPDYFSGRLIPDPDELKRVNPFDWNREFPEAMKSGGFDCVIGNPPYIRIQTMQESSPKQVEYLKRAYLAAGSGNYDIYVVFAERGLSLLDPRGRLGFILPHKFFNSKYGEPLRGLIAQGRNLAHVVHFGDKQIFAGATTYTCLMFLDRAGNEIFDIVSVNNLESWQRGEQQDHGLMEAKSVTSLEWKFSTGVDRELFDRLNQFPTKLGDISHLFVGLQTDADDVYIVEELEKKKEVVLCKSKATGSTYWLENEHLKPLLKGSLNIRRYYLSNITKRLIFPYEMRDGKSILIDENYYKRKYPLTWAYLEVNQKRLAARNNNKMGNDWYGYVYKKNHTRFENPKLLVPSIANGSCFAEDLRGIYYFVGSGGGGGGGYAISLNQEINISYYYLLGLLNSKVLEFILKKTSTPFRGGYFALNRQYIKELPIQLVDISKPKEKAQHDQIVLYVESMLGLHMRKLEVKSRNEQEIINRQIKSLDVQIDRLVFELYELNKDQIAIIEDFGKHEN